MKETKIENCPFPGCGKRCVTLDAGNGCISVYCSVCCYKSCEWVTREDAISAHNDLCRKLKGDEKPLPRMVEVASVLCEDETKTEWHRRELIFVVDDYALPYVCLSPNRSSSSMFPHMREIEEPKTRPMTFDELFGGVVYNKHNNDRRTLCDGNPEAGEQGGFYLFDGMYVTVEEIVEHYTHPDGSPLTVPVEGR